MPTGIRKHGTRRVGPVKSASLSIPGATDAGASRLTRKDLASPSSYSPGLFLDDTSHSSHVAGHHRPAAASASASASASATGVTTTSIGVTNSNVDSPAVNMLATPSQTPDSTTTGPAPPPAPTVIVEKITRGHSCILCQQRKVKCNRQKPCNNCIKARAECIPSAPTVPRRRRRKLSEQDQGSKLRRYEQLLKKNGIKIDDDDDEDGDEPASAGDSVRPGIGLDTPRPPKADTGMLITEKGNTRYVENTLWENLRDEINDSRGALQMSSDDDEENGLYPEAERFLVSHGMPKDLTSQHPPPIQVFRLWQTYLVNVNPLVKVFHAPSTQQAILDATSDLSTVPKHVEALMFAIYLLSVTSLQQEECESMMGTTRNNLIAKYAQATQQALINARFLKSLNLTTLQAYVLYLLATRKCYDAHSCWVLTGTAVRIAQRLGIHRDGASHKMSPFDAEMRRRTWWQIIFLDGQASKLAGAGFPGWLTQFDAKMPLNISDSDLNPTMTELPAEKDGVTEMVFCSLRYEVAQALRSTGTFNFPSEFNSNGKTPVEIIAEKDKVIDDLDALFQRKYIRFCDPSVPAHIVAIYMSKSVISTMRLMAHHPRQYPDKGASMAQSEKDMIFGESLKALEIAGIIHANKAVQGFLWHIHVHFQLDAIVYILSELCVRTEGAQVERAWHQIDTAYQQRPELINEKNSLYFAIGNLVLKAWQKREDAGGLYEGSAIENPPRFITLLRSQRKLPERTQIPESKPKPIQDAMELQPDAPLPEYHNFNSYNALNTINTVEQWNNNVDFGMDMGMPDLNVADLEYYQTLLGSDLSAFTGQDWETLEASRLLT